MIKKKQNFIVPLVVYPFDIMVSLGENNYELGKKMKKNGLLDTQIDQYFNKEITEGRCYQFDTQQILLRLRDYPHTSRDYGTLSHEIFHAVNFVMDMIGIKLCEHSDEAYAYLIGYLTEKIYLKINE